MSLVEFNKYLAAIFKILKSKSKYEYIYICQYIFPYLIIFIESMLERNVYKSTTVR